MLGEGEISLEQLYKMLHVSKRKAAWMLQNGIIPCRIRPTATDFARKRKPHKRTTEMSFRTWTNE